MAVTDRSGADGTAIAIGRQTAYGTPVKVRTDMIPVLFPVSALTIDEDADTEETNLITAFGGAPPVETGQLYATGGFTTRLLPDYIFHILEGILNPTKNASTDVPSGALGTASGTTVTITNTKYPGHGSPAIDVGYPSKVKITGGSGAGTMKVVGKREAGRQIGSDDRLSAFYQEETVALTAGAGETTKFFASVDVDGITLTGITGSSTITFEPDTKRTVVQFQATDPQFDGWTALCLKGGTPNRVTDYVPGAMNVSAGDAGIDVEITGIGTRYDEYVTISDAAGFDTPKFALESADTSYYANPPLKSFPGWAGALLFGSEVVRYTAIDFGINRNYENSPGIAGERFKYGVSAQGNREVTFSPTSYLRAGDATDTFLKFRELFRNDAREDMIMDNRAYDSNGRRYQMLWECANGQIAESPRAEVTGQGPIERPLVFRALPGAGNVPEIVITMYSSVALYT